MATAITGYYQVVPGSPVAPLGRRVPGPTYQAQMILPPAILERVQIWFKGIQVELRSLALRLLNLSKFTVGLIQIQMRDTPILTRAALLMVSMSTTINYRGISGSICR